MQLITSYRLELERILNDLAAYDVWDWLPVYLSGCPCFGWDKVNFVSSS